MLKKKCCKKMYQEYTSFSTKKRLCTSCTIQINKKLTMKVIEV